MSEIKILCVKAFGPQWSSLYENNSTFNSCNHLDILQIHARVQHALLNGLH
jgi:hypothetical protein